MSKVGVAASPKAQERKKAEVERETLIGLRDMQKVLSTLPGRRTILRIVKASGYFRRGGIVVHSATGLNELRTGEEAGKRALAEAVLSLVSAANHEYFKELVADVASALFTPMDGVEGDGDGLVEDDDPDDE